MNKNKLGNKLENKNLFNERYVYKAVYNTKDLVTEVRINGIFFQINSFKKKINYWLRYIVYYRIISL